ncbi:MAG: UDP-N-acetylmuramoyl-tripeptide--D-alanyl-D-alanine ligase [Spirochaetia bacterium]|jgi:UDP-N-acetylmuramoyl-tripeptide--D-alanyl-D-alanine ligase|nr:UDP-N-acetylmuramoyl-tripeptide--D-alanyl-D-alanine ligase [Spirochaetia bacterium]
MSEKLFTLQEIAAVTGGEAVCFSGFAEEEIFSVSVDSRKALPGGLFVPLPGERTDGHLYIEEAFSRGCRACLAGRDYWEARRGELEAGARKLRRAFVVVDSPLAALHALAARHLGGFGAFRVGITGSSGKTTTKEIVGAILSQEGPSFMNEGNLNSEIGLPLSVFGMRGSPGFAVFEMGMNRAGEMDALVGIVRPQAGLITNIAQAHIGILGSLENIAVEKKKLFQALERGQKAYVHEGEGFRDFLAEGIRADLVFYGEDSTPGFGGAKDLGLDGWVITLDGGGIRFPLPGRYNLRNALGAVSLCKGLGVSGRALRGGLQAVAPLFGRGQIFRGEFTLVLDCYNANPQSMRGALDFVDSLAWKGRKVAVLGAMKELGGLSAVEHENLGWKIAACGFAAVFLFGEEMGDAFRVLEEGGFAGRLGWFTDFDGLRGAVGDFLVAGDIVLVKGSRSMELERLADALCGGAKSGKTGAVHV